MINNATSDFFGFSLAGLAGMATVSTVHSAPVTHLIPWGTAATGGLVAQSTRLSDPIWSQKLQQWAGALAQHLGPWIEQEVFWGITWLQLVLSAALLAGAALSWIVIRWLMRSWIKQESNAMAAAPKSPDAETGDSEPVPWIKLSLEALLPPLAVFLWIWGAYMALYLLFAHLQSGAERPLVLTVLIWVKDFGTIAALFWFFFRLINVVDVRVKRWAELTQNKWDNVMAIIVVRALRLIVPLMGIILTVPMLNISPDSHFLFNQGASLLIILAVGYILFQLVGAVETAVLQQFRIDVKDNLKARKIYTQVRVLKKLAVVVIVIFTVASMLMVFESVRRLGASLLASAGVMGIIVGFAAQKSIATVVAGFQIAMTQPIRLDDVVIVENEWGWIEEITLTYVVVRIWDLRRLIVPINYFIEKPFQNWTRVSSDLLGTVFVYTDYTVPLDALRKELDRILDNSPLWDRKVKGIQVTSAREHTLEVRILVSTADSGKGWNLRCEVREKMIDFLQKNYPQSLPKTRAELNQLPEFKRQPA